MVSSIDVAKKAGVSQATVSRVLNHAECVRPKTRDKVLKAIEELRYQPNLIARSLVTKSTKMIALISGSVINPFFAETTDSIIQVASLRGYQITVCFEEAWFSTAVGNHVDGILLSSLSLDDPLFVELENSGIPYMLFNRKPRHGGNYVVLDNKLASAMVTQHLLDLGHKRIAYLSGSVNLSTFQERLQGFTETLQKADFTVDQDLIYSLHDPAADVEKVTWTIMNGPEPPTAILGSNDAIALLCMDTLLSMGIPVPEQVSLAGIDNIKITSHRAINLTSVGHRNFQMGEIAMECLIDMIEGRQQQGLLKQITLKPELVVRQTTCKARF